MAEVRQWGLGTVGVVNYRTSVHRIDYLRISLPSSNGSFAVPVRPFLLALLAASAITACADRAAQEEVAKTDALPVDRIGQVLALQPGVIANSRSDESVTYVDGVPVQSGNGGNAFYSAAGGPRRIPGDTATLPTMLIRTGYASVQVDSLEPAIAGLEAIARRVGGYVGNTSFSGGEENRRSATLQLRIPAARFDEARTGIDALGKVLAVTVQVQDVGEEYSDASARLSSKRQVETRLLELLRTQVGKLSDVVELEQALAQVREEIESTEGRLRYLRNQVGLSTMTVMLTEPGVAIAEPGYHPIRDSFGVAWRNFTGFIAGIIASAGWVLPLAVLLYAGFLILKRAWVRRTA